MRVIVIGAGPTGLTLAAALAHRGHDVTAVDRDPGPAPDGAWRRRGVMQFDMAHGFRPPVRDLLAAEWPAAWDSWLGLGAVPIEIDLPGLDRAEVGVRSRRSTYERALRIAAVEVPGLDVRCARVDDLLRRRGRVVGVRANRQSIDADLVVDASGRAGRPAGAVTYAVRHDCALAYVNRTYRLHPGAELGPLTTPAAWGGTFDGYHAMVFPHERGHFSVVLLRGSRDRELARLRDPRAFDAAVSAIPALAAWTDPERSRPTGDVVPGAGLLNAYRPQRSEPGLVTIGDAVATTAPTAGRGVALASLQIGALLRLLDDGHDATDVAAPFGAWCDEHIRPWVDDHIAMDTATERQLDGGDLDLALPLSSSAIADAAQIDPRIASHLGPVLAMHELPSSLGPVEPLARAVYEAGWQRPFADGPTRDELLDIIERAPSEEQVAAPAS